MQFLMSLRTLRRKTIFLPQSSYFLATVILQNPVAFAVFAHATLLKVGPEFRYILNIITVAGSADANAADADPEFQNPHISDTLLFN